MLFFFVFLFFVFVFVFAHSQYLADCLSSARLQRPWHWERCLEFPSRRRRELGIKQPALEGASSVIKGSAESASRTSAQHARLSNLLLLLKVGSGRVVPAPTPSCTRTLSCPLKNTAKPPQPPCVRARARGSSLDHVRFPEGDKNLLQELSVQCACVSACVSE